MTRAEALAILENGEFDQLVGRPETLEVEFKGEPYQLDRESQKFDVPPQDDIDKYFLVQRPLEEGADSTPVHVILEPLAA